jgi:hypothetical protein
MVLMKKHLIYLDFDIIKNDGGSYNIIGKNAISALWLSGIIPIDVQAILDNNKFIIDDVKYTYNKKTNKLTYKIIDNE